MTQKNRVNDYEKVEEYKKVYNNKRLRQKKIKKRRRQRRRVKLAFIAIIFIVLYGIKSVFFTGKNVTDSNKDIEISEKIETTKEPKTNTKIQQSTKIQKAEETKTSNNNKTKNENKDKDRNDVSILVNKKRPLSSDYVPEDLVIPNVDFIFEGYAEQKNLRKPAADALDQLFNAAAEEGYYLIAVSGYRSYDYQRELFENEVAQYGNIEDANEWVAKPGESEHQTGLAMDICSSFDGNVLEEFEGTPEAQWIYKHCNEYGFILRYPKDKTDITGYKYEAWHIRYVGKKIAEDIKEKDLTYDEYYEKYLE